MNPKQYEQNEFEERLEFADVCLPVTLWPRGVVRTGFVLLLDFSGRIRRI